MATYTTNLNLKKPAGSENVSIGDINNNMDTIDSAVGTLNDQIASISTGTLSSETGVTNIRTSLVKSIKTVTLITILQKTLVLNQNNLLAILPSGFRPRDSIIIAARNATKETFVKVEISSSSGGIYVYPTSADSDASAANIQISVTFISA